MHCRKRSYLPNPETVNPKLRITDGLFHQLTGTFSKANAPKLRKNSVY